jgi:hypothetical protein
MIILAIALAVTAHAAASSPADVAGDLRITVAYMKPGHLLRVTITNVGTTPLQMNDAWVPWAHLYAMQLVAVRPADPFGPSQPLVRTTAIDDPVGRRVTIRPGEGLTGEIELDQQFPDLPAALARDDMLLFWSYVPLYAPNTMGIRTGGWLLLPNEKPLPDASTPDNKQMQRTAPGPMGRRR